MTKIELLNDYFIEVDEMNHTLKKRYIGTDTKTGQKVPKEKIIGYYGNIIDCVERLTRLICIEEMQGEVICMRQYAEASERAFNKVKECVFKEWIPCKDRLPECGQKVLTCDKEGWITVNINMQYQGKKNDFECGYYVAWMPLPTPYKEKKK